MDSWMREIFLPGTTTVVMVVVSVALLETLNEGVAVVTVATVALPPVKPRPSKSSSD